MKKKRTVAKFIIIACLCAVLAFLTMFSFHLAGNSQDYDFVGFARAINFGVEYRGGTALTYKVVENTKSSNLQKAISNNATRIEYLLDNKGYESNVYQDGNNIVVELFDEYSPVGIEEMINAEVNFSIKKEQSDTAEAVVSSKDVSNAYATKSGSQNVIVIEFTSEGSTKYQTLLDGTGYFYIGNNSPFSIDLSNSNPNYVGIVVKNWETAKDYASQIMSSKFDLEFNNIDTTTYSAQDAQKNVIVMLALVIGLFVLISVLLIAMFKTLGLIGSFAMFIGLLLQILLVQAVPEHVFIFTGAALYASLLAMAIGALAVYSIFAKMHKEYKLGKILNASVKFGYQKSWKMIIDIFVLLLVPTVMGYFFGTYVVKQFAMAFMCGLAIYAFVALVLVKFFAKWLTYISFKNTHYGFKREAHVDELK
ncbi:MAG: hypothetical protein IKR12_00415 [Clostridia bacterium]|nr:hypothetical protein [Clostridia bacterium]